MEKRWKQDRETKSRQQEGDKYAVIVEQHGVELLQFRVHKN